MRIKYIFEMACSYRWLVILIDHFSKIDLLMQIFDQDINGYNLFHRLCKNNNFQAIDNFKINKPK